MGKTIEIYGVLTAIQPIYEDFYCTIKEEGTDKEFNVFIPQENLLWDLEKDGHYYIKGEISLDVVNADYADRWGRYCDICCKWHTEGYYVYGDYACSEECAIALYNGDADVFKADLALLDNPATADDAEVYWTEWD